MDATELNAELQLLKNRKTETQASLPKLNLGGFALQRLEDFQRDSTYKSFRDVITKFISYLQELFFIRSELTYVIRLHIQQKLSNRVKPIIHMIYKLSKLALFYLVFIVILFEFIMLSKSSNI